MATSEDRQKLLEWVNGSQSYPPTAEYSRPCKKPIVVQYRLRIYALVTAFQHASPTEKQIFPFADASRFPRPPDLLNFVHTHSTRTELKQRSRTGILNTRFPMAVFTAHKLTEQKPSEFLCSQSSRDADVACNGSTCCRSV